MKFFFSNFHKKNIKELNIERWKNSVKGNLRLSPYRPGQALGAQEVEASRIS